MGETQPVGVFGDYEDSVRRNLTAAATGTVYASSPPGVVSVGPDGLVAATGPGTATVIARNGDFQASTTVEVKIDEPVCGDGVVQWGEECDDGNTEPEDGCDPACALEGAGPPRAGRVRSSPESDSAGGAAKRLPPRATVLEPLHSRIPARHPGVAATALS